MITGGPAFSAYRGTSDQTPITANTWVKVQLNTETFDTDSAFDSMANYRFQPAVAGYYQINGNVLINSSSTVTTGGAQVYKNGAGVATSVMQSPGTATTVCVATVVYLNGSTDYVELYGYGNGVGTLYFGQGVNTTTMSGVLVRA